MIRPTFDLLRALARSSQLKSSRGPDAVLTDRIVRAGTQPTLLAAIERLAGELEVALDYVAGDTFAAFARGAGSEEAARVLAWLRRYPRMAAMIATLRNDEDYGAALAAVELPPAGAAADAAALRAGGFDVPLQVHLISPLAHGSDIKAGNASLYRRQQVLAAGGAGVLELPYYAGNALRGQLRDLLADHFVAALGLTPSRSDPPLALWFFHALYAGGVLEEGAAAHKRIVKELGDHGAVRASGIARLRALLPALSLLGVALGNRILCGRVNVADLRPRCRQWGNGEVDAAQLMEWVYLTRREDHEAHAEHSGMIAQTECLRAGVVLEGGIDVDSHAGALERAALGRGLALLAARGMLGAQNARGLGRCAIVVEGAPDPAPYDAYLTREAGAILDYLREVGAFVDGAGGARG